MSLTLRTGLVIALQIAVLLSMIGMKQWTLATGTPVVLETAPVDPRSLFSGDYVRLGYAISNLQPDKLAGAKDFKHHDPIYVVLQTGTRYAVPVALFHEMPALAPGRVAIRGEVEYQSSSRWDPQTQTVVEENNISVHYGIETWYLPEGSGRALERPPENAKIAVRVAVDRNGAAGILGILVDGQERYRQSLL